MNRARTSVFSGSMMVHQPLTFVEITGYCELNCIRDSRSRTLLSRMTIALDKVYMQHHLDTLKEEAEKAKKAAKAKDKRPVS